MHDGSFQTARTYFLSVRFRSLSSFTCCYDFFRRALRNSPIVNIALKCQNQLHLVTELDRTNDYNISKLQVLLISFKNSNIILLKELWNLQRVLICQPVKFCCCVIPETCLLRENTRHWIMGTCRENTLCIIDYITLSDSIKNITNIVLKKWKHNVLFQQSAGSGFLTNQKNSLVLDVTKSYIMSYTRPFVRSSSSCELLLSRLLKTFLRSWLTNYAYDRRFWTSQTLS